MLIQRRVRGRIRVSLHPNPALRTGALPPSGGVRKPRCEEDRRLSPVRKIGVCSEGQRQGSESDPPRLARRTEHSRLWCAARQPFAYIAHQPSLSGSGTPAPVRPSACVLCCCPSPGVIPRSPAGDLPCLLLLSARLKACPAPSAGQSYMTHLVHAETRRRQGETQRCCGSAGWLVSNTQKSEK